MIKAVSHLVLATHDVKAITHFFSDAFSLKPHFENEMFSEFVIPSRFRIAFFKPVGKAGDFFEVTEARKHVGLGITVESVEKTYERLQGLAKNWKITFSGPPKDHPWGEKSFLMIDPDGNQWEITQSPSKDGLLVNKS